MNTTGVHSRLILTFFNVHSTVRFLVRGAFQALL